MNSDPLEAAFLRLRHAADADEYVPTERVIDTVLARLAAAWFERDEARYGLLEMHRERDEARDENERLREALRLAVDLLDDLELGLSEHQASIVEQVRSAITTDDKP